jgi:hypothetical protein
MDDEGGDQEGAGHAAAAQPPPGEGEKGAALTAGYDSTTAVFWVREEPPALLGRQ